MRAAVAGIPGAWSSEQMAASLRDEGIDAFVFSLSDTVHDLVAGSVSLGGRKLAFLDAIVVKKLGDQSSAAARLRLNALRALERRGTRVFSPPDVIDVAMDRYAMTVRLAEDGLPVPRTLFAESEAGLIESIGEVREAVLKPVYTSKGRGMVRVSAGSMDTGGVPVDASAGPYLVQQYVRSPGRDIGATVIGGKFEGAFYRVASDGEWRTTTSQGGRYEPCTLTARGVELAERAASLFKLDYTVVDLVEQGDEFLIYEVSAFGGFKGLLEATGADPSITYARHVRRVLGG